MRVYLAGPITGQTWEGATDWREAWIERLRGTFTMVGVSPMRGKDYLKPEIEANGNVFHATEYATLHPMSSRSGIFRRDTFDVRTCDILLANFLDCGERISIGTIFEIGLAWSLGKYIIVVMDEENIHNHAFITEAASVVVDSLDEALNVLRVLEA